MKKLLIATLIALLGLAGFGVWQVKIVNPAVEAELKNDPSGERAARTMLLTFVDGKTIPVNYLEENGKIYAGADGGWWKRFSGKGEPVDMLIRGRAMSGYAVAITDDPAYTHDIFRRLRPKVPAWLPDWLNGVLIEITPDQ